MALRCHARCRGRAVSEPQPWTLAVGNCQPDGLLVFFPHGRQRIYGFGEAGGRLVDRLGSGSARG